MKILLIHQYFLEKEDAGGSRFNEMTRIWASQGHKVTVLAGMVHYASGTKPKKYKGKWFVKEQDFYPGVDVVRCHVSEKYNISFLGRLWAYFSFVFSGIWAGLFKLKNKHDVILVTSPPLFVGIIATVLSCVKRKPMVFEVRDLWPESAIDTGVLKNKLIIKFAYWFESYVYKRAKFINVLTPAFKQTLINKKGVPSNKITFVPNAADFDLSDHVLSDFDTNRFRKEKNLDGKFVITYVGAHGVANHLIQLLEAAERLKDTPVFFQLIGSGMQKQQLQDIAKAKSLHNVRFVDPVPKKDVFMYILASDVGTSVLKKVDTFKTIYSNKTFDYMACKKPVLMLVDGISRELVEEANCGIYAEPENIEDIETKVRFLMNNSQLLNEYGENGYRHAKKYFDRNVLANKYVNHLKEVI